MERISLRQLLLVSLLPNLFVTIWLVLVWGRGELHVHQVWKNAPSVFRAFLYLLLVFIVYFGIMSWICLLMNTLTSTFPRLASLLNPVINPNKPSNLLLLFWGGVVVVGGILAVPFVMTRAHAVHSTLLELGEIGYFFGLLFATLSAYGFLWNFVDRVFDRGDKTRIS